MNIFQKAKSDAHQRKIGLNAEDKHEHSKVRG